MADVHIYRGTKMATLPMADGLSADARIKFDARWTRILDTIELRKPDRMATSLIGSFWMAKYGGISCRELMYNYELSNEINERAFLEFEPDMAGASGPATSYGHLLDAIEFKQLEWPGHGVGENYSYQYLDGEYMLAEEYDDFLFDPTGFLFEKYLPRIAGAYEGLRPLGRLMGNSFLGVATQSAAFAAPDMVAAFEKLNKSGQEAFKSFASFADMGIKMANHGFPPFACGSTQAPYDVLADYMRGAKNMMKDLYRRPDKVLEVLDKLSEFIFRRTMERIVPGGSPMVVIPIHWAPDNFMSQKQFETFYWPSLKKMMLKFIDKGLVPMPLWEADCTRRLETIADMPEGKCLYWFENTDLVNATNILRGRVAMYGNLGASLMTTGKPEDVDAAVKNLVDNVYNKGGSLILSTSSPMPDETPIANVRAMFDAAKKYGGN